MSGTRPEGTVTFLFTDIEGSTRLLQHLGERYADLLAAHHEAMRAVIAAHAGHEVDTQGDAFFVAFADAAEALQCAVAAQHALAKVSWPDGVDVRVRMGLHTGEAVVTPTGYVGLPVHVAARIASAGYGGQVLASRPVVDTGRGVAARAIDLGEHRLKDIDEPAWIFQVYPADADAFPPIKSLGDGPNNLPAGLSSFVGREEVLADAAARLPETRLLTVLGAGGSGKTRLALEFAGRVRRDFPGGTWYVDLVPADAGGVPEAVARVLHVRQAPGRDLADSIVDSLLARRALLLLDNCEHVIAAAASLAERIVSACPDVAVVATSREALRVGPERVLQLDPMRTDEAVDLFTQRAVAVRPGFVLDEAASHAVGELCRRLDGIPLAIELAAARVRSMSVEQIAARLSDRFRLLSGGSRTASRHQTLRAALEWSYDLLDEAERDLFARLSVFAGAFGLEDAEAVCAGDGLDDLDVVDHLVALVDKSLVSVGDQDRFRLLESVRELAAEKLEASGRSSVWRDRHADHFARLARSCAAAFRGPRQVEIADRLDDASQDLSAAIVYVAEAGRPEAAALAADVAGFWELRGRYDEGITHLQRALESAPADGSDELGCLVALGRLTRLAGSSEASAGYMQRALERARAAGDVANAALAEHGLAVLARRAGSTSEAERRSDEAVGLARMAGDPRVLATALAAKGSLAMDRSDWEEARRVRAETLELDRTTGEVAAIAASLYDTGTLLIATGDVANASGRLEDALLLQRALKDPAAVARTLDTLGVAAMLRHESAEAARWFDEAVEAARRCGHIETAVAALVHRSSVAIQSGDEPLAERILREVIELSERLGLARERLHARLNQGVMAANRGDLASAMRFYEQCLADAVEVGDVGLQAQVELNLGLTALVLSQPDRALRWLEGVLASAGRLEATGARGLVLNALACARLQLGDPTAAVAASRESVELLRAQDDQEAVAASLTTLALALLLQGRPADAVAAAAEAMRIRPAETPLLTARCLLAAAAAAAGPPASASVAALLFGAYARAAAIDATGEFEYFDTAFLVRSVEATLAGRLTTEESARFREEGSALAQDELIEVLHRLHRDLLGEVEAQQIQS